ncbi:12331_t:CDS:2, partial [Gigaspora rosea]
LSHEQQSDKDFNCINEDVEYKIEDSMEFPTWDTFERTLKKHKLKIIDADHREKDSKKVGYSWQLNAECRKNIGVKVINKLINEYNHSLASYRKKFAPSLRSLLQEVLDKIKFLTQECGLGAKAQYQYLSKKFSVQPLYNWLPSIQSVFFEPVQDAIKKYLTLESASVQNIQISQSILYHASLFENSCDLISLPNAYEYADEYFEDEYNLVLLFDQYKHNTSAMEFDLNEEINQVISICESAKSRLKFALESGLVNEFVELITEFIKNYTGVDTNKRMTVK